MNGTTAMPQPGFAGNDKQPDSPSGTMKKAWSKYILFTSLLLTMHSQCVHQPVNKPESYSDLVYPMLDAANSRWFYFNSASRPFGMVNLSPDTETNGAWGSGYRYDTDTIRGFSHIHAWQLAGLQVMPVVTGTLEAKTILHDFQSSFSHESEMVRPGYHQVFLERNQIGAELTSTCRVGMHRYVFPKGQQPGLAVALSGILGPCVMKDGEVKQLDSRTLEGSLVAGATHRRPKDFRIFYTIACNRDITHIEMVDSVGFVITWEVVPGQDTVLMKVALSYTSTDNSRYNLEHEIPHWDFDQVVSESRQEWDQLLGRIEIEGGTDQARRRFYTDLWHSLQGRRILNDLNGYYPDYTGEEFRIGRLPMKDAGVPEFNQYNSDSFWGAQWTLNTLWGLVYPDIMESFVRSLLQYGEDGGLVPRGPSGGNYTYVMTGASSTPFIVSAYQKGLRNWDAEKGYQALLKNHLPGGMMAHAGYEHDTELGGGLNHYIHQGYVPYPIPEGQFGYHQDGASLTLEYAYQDWTLAQFARSLHHRSDEQMLMARSQSFRNVWDSTSGWMRPRSIDGTWLEPFDPYVYEHGFNESNSAQSTWFVPHDPMGLATLMGGKEKAIDRLEQQFIQAQPLGFTSGNSHDRETHPEYVRIPINYGNQPSMQTAHLFQAFGRPDLTQFWLRQIIDSVYQGLTPYTGYNGDEDQGLMGSLAVLLKLGLFQLNGGTEPDPAYLVTMPYFDKITIHLHPAYYPGNELIILRERTDKDPIYIKKALWNGETLDTLSLPHKQLTQGGTLLIQANE